MESAFGLRVDPSFLPLAAKSQAGPWKKDLEEASKPLRETTSLIPPVPLLLTDGSTSKESAGRRRDGRRGGGVPGVGQSVQLQGGARAGPQGGQFPTRGRRPQKQELRAPLYNPVHKKIPVLLHAGKPIAESLVILEYIDETWKQNPILPVDPYERANARFWATYVDDKCMEILWRSCWTRGEEQQKCISEAGERLRTLETALEGKKFFGGDTIGFVDIVVSFLTPWMEVLQEMARIRLLEEENYPGLCRWVRDFSSCDVVKETRPPREKLVAFFATLKPPN
ncbi:unnamed protein product [Spirodela intermedia]|uniref:glutathione transferase n=1 Tax=Spirodela intermedia TaxID=51605 RepID=A0A7I8IBT2_SPIIN|nr:unnamed protein product [Spirodela intermedia]CAA6654502.1 unnamed protein product [Spirodela intermedia]